MSFQVCAGAMLQCSFGTTPSPLTVLPTNKVLAMAPAATILDHQPLLNVVSFGACQSAANPAVASATAAAMGVLTPMPCVPATPAPWLPGRPKVIIGSAPALDKDAKLLCMWGGIIQVQAPGQFVVKHA